MIVGVVTGESVDLMPLHSHTLLLMLASSPTPLRHPAPRRCHDPSAAIAQQLQEIRVCTNRSCRKQGSFQTLETLSGLAPPNVEVKPCCCLGRCGGGPNLVVLPNGVIIGHCGTAARAAEIMANLFAGGEDDAKTSLDALALRKRAENEFKKRNFTEAELLLSQVHLLCLCCAFLSLSLSLSFFLFFPSSSPVETDSGFELMQAIDLKPFGGLHVTFKCRFVKLDDSGCVFFSCISF